MLCGIPGAACGPLENLETLADLTASPASAATVPAATFRGRAVS